MKYLICVILISSIASFSHGFWSSSVFNHISEQIKLAAAAELAAEAEAATAGLSEAGNWDVSLREGKFVLIDAGGILVPVQYESSEVILSSQQAFLRFSDGAMSGVVSTPVSRQVIPAGTGYAMRPTLVVSIHGFEGFDNSGHVGGKTGWQNNITTELRNYMGDSQFKHFLVDWHSDKSNRRQSSDVADHVKNFLDNRLYEWDVVLVGHSRGGIFAHELSKKLLGQTNINSLHTVLLDPTASTSMGDIYPHSLYKSSKTPHKGSFYLDGECFIDALNLCGPTDSDYEISGYDSYPFAAPHAGYASAWIESAEGFNAVMGNLVASKEVFSEDTFGHDFTDSGLMNLDAATTEVEAIDDLDSVITVHIDDIYVDGEFDVGSDYVSMWAEANIGPVLAGANVYLGKNGVEAAANVAFLSASAAIREDYVGISSDTGVASISTSLSEDGAVINYRYLGFGQAEGEISLDRVGFSSSILGADHSSGVEVSGGGVKIELGGETIFSVSL